MVNRVKILENLEEIISVMRVEISAISKKEDYDEHAAKLQRAIGVMQRVYEKIREKSANEPIVKLVERYYSDAWDVISPPTFEKRFDYAM